MLGVFTLSFSPVLAETKFDPICFSRLLQAMVTDYGTTTALDARRLPRTIELHPHGSEVKRMSKFAKRAFRKESRLKEIMRAVDHLADGVAEPLDQTTITQLKTGRKYGVIIRDSFFLFDRKHVPPETLENFVVKYGKLNDAIRVNVSTEEITKAAQDLRKSFEKLPDLDVVEKFKPDSGKGFSSYLDETLDKLNDNLKKTELSSEEYHETRKIIRRFASYFQIKGAIDPSPETEITMKYLKALSDLMGDTHNEMILKNATGVEKYKDIHQKLEPIVRKKLEYFLRASELQ